MPNRNPWRPWKSIGLWVTGRKVRHPCRHRDGMLLAESEFVPRRPEEEVVELQVRCRTIGDISCTGLWESTATDLEGIIQEVAVARQTERGGRADDKRTETAMEDRKKEGYF